MGEVFQKLRSSSWPELSVLIYRLSVRHVFGSSTCASYVACATPLYLISYSRFLGRKNQRDQTRKKSSRFLVFIFSFSFFEFLNFEKKRVGSVKRIGPMNGGGGGEGGEEMEEDGKDARKGKEMEVDKKKAVLMWGYLPGVSLQRSPLLYPVPVPLPGSPISGDSWKDVCGGGCGFAMAISESGKLLTWGSTDDMGQSYLTSGKHEEIPEAYPLPTQVAIVKAAAGWAHCVAVTAHGDVYTWGWKECVPSGRVIVDQTTGGAVEKDEKEVKSRSNVSRTSGGPVSSSETRGGEESAKRRKLSSAKQGQESSTSGDENLSAPPCLVTLNSGVRITAVAAGGRHTLALSDVGQVWGWGYGGEGQLGLGSRIRLVSSPHPVPCIGLGVYGRDRSAAIKRNSSSDEQVFMGIGNYVKAIACGGRHSAVITDTGALLTFGWGLYGQCGQGSVDDELSPKCVTALLGIKIKGVATGLWHTLCISADGDVYAFGGNQFGQLGTGTDQAETLPKLLDASCLENKNAKIVSCGARHSAITTEEGDVFCWGWNKYGQLGLGDAIDRSLPIQVQIDNYFPTNISCGWWHTLLLAEAPT
ncbi:Regulator of chromosome condensation 1/beta-lactamase-inhibitor protein II [Dioscorea alata]|uniref:Regulator of chromosome condensation 1/beta-lactamase-inhibitor protein II n=1 Tax=Dioscorea alata TaxID=55571 RepID=A0ACB7VG92_DIOAL|nr:Regulator of chromosome condensation 1/beta-lactamase-inhibitor protein II [Dioscorea alata]